MPYPEQKGFRVATVERRVFCEHFIEAEDDFWAGRGYSPEREVLTGRSYVVQPAEHVGHTVTVVRPVGVANIPSHHPAMRHVVRCSCGEERRMDDDTLQDLTAPNARAASDKEDR